jgi:hypothetical protein
MVAQGGSGLFRGTKSRPLLAVIAQVRPLHRARGSMGC